MPCPRRPFINPNDGFFEVLLDYAEELGREQTATARPTSTAEELAAARTAADNLRDRLHEAEVRSATLAVELTAARAAATAS